MKVITIPKPTLEDGMNYVQMKLTGKNTQQLFNNIKCFGGDFEDLDLFIKKVNNNFTYFDAKEDIISSAQQELEKKLINSRSAHYSRQLWYLINELSTKKQV